MCLCVVAEVASPVGKKNKTDRSDWRVHVFVFVFVCLGRVTGREKK
jgi:hypothetical protein